ncbi:MAG TPA: putative LPS assembly protein LptD, partial [Gemmatimonadaceae bacterium]
MTWPRCLAAAAALVLVVVAAWRAEGQGRPGRPPGQRPPPARGDTLHKSDSITVKDTIGKANFVEPDSVMRRLLSTPGYTITRYQGEGITFDAITRGIQLTNKAVVQRGDSQVVKSDTITYSGQGSRVQVCSTPTGRNVFAAPGQAPVVSSRCGTYDITNKRAAVSNASTSVPQSGETLFITGDRIVVVAGSDSVHNANDATYYLRDGTITACDDSIPDYYFKASEIKRTGSFVVARPAILYIGDVPVMWLPFLFQDIRGGRHSGILSPNFGVADIVRNSPTYRRSLEGLGYYWAISDFLDTEAWLDWRSSAGDIQPGDIGGFTRYNGEFRYRWLERYVTGSFAASRTLEGDQRNTSITWGHQEQFTRNSSLTMNLNYASNDRVQRLTTVNPYSVLSTIRSTASYNQKVGPMSFTLGGTRTQYPGRTQVEQTFPTVNMTTSPLSIGSWLVWTPAMTYSSHQLTGIDQPSSLSLLPHDSATAAGKDSIFTDTLRRNAYDSNLDIQTPLQIFGYNLGNSFTITSHRNAFPEAELVTGVNTGVSEQRVYSTT